MAINSNNKGKRGELEFANLLKKHGYLESRRTQQYSGTEGTSDVTSEKLPHHIEVKRNERLNVSKAMQQAVDDSNGEMPIVAHRKNREEWLITMRFSDWIEDMKKIY